MCGAVFADAVDGWLCGYSGDYHHCRYHRLLTDHKKMIPVVAAALLEAFAKGEVLAVSVYLLKIWLMKRKSGML